MAKLYYTVFLIAICNKINIISVAWTASTDSGGSGLDGYVTSWDQNPATLPGGIKDLGNTATATFSSALSPANNWYFHIRPVDVAGNRATATHLGPFWIDAAPALINPPANAKLTITTPTPTFS